MTMKKHIFFRIQLRIVHEIYEKKFFFRDFYSSVLPFLQFLNLQYHADFFFRCFLR